MVKVTDKQIQKTLKFESTSVEVALSSEEKHPNKLPFTATFMLIDSPSDGTPMGADMPVVIDMEEAKNSVSTMDLMAIDCVWDDWMPEYCMTGHDSRNKIGLVEKAYIEGNEMKMKGFIYALDFPDIAFFIKNATSSLGFSMECLSGLDAQDDGYEHMTGVTFTGVAILFQNLAAFESTYIDYLAAAKKEKEKLTKEEMDALKASLKETIEAGQKEFADKLKDVSERLETLEASKKQKVESDLEAKVKELEAAKEQAEKEAQKAVEAAKKEADEKAKAEKEALEQKVADLEAAAKRKSVGAGKSAKGFGSSDEDFKGVWDNGFDKGISLMCSKMKEKIEAEGEKH